METVEGLYQSYSQRFKADGTKLKDEVKRLTQRYYDRWELTAQAIACGVAVTSLVNAEAIDFEKLDPQILDAFELAYPNVPIENLASASPEQLAGYVNAWKGKLFEVQVRDQLNAGEVVGSIKLEHGQHAELAASATQPGWDLQILNEDNTVAEAIQLKATESMSYVRDAMERYPEFHVLATSDVANQADILAGLSVASVSEEELQQAVEAPFADTSDSGLWDTLLPGLPFLLIVTRQGLSIFSGEKNWSEALAASIVDSARSAIAIGGAHAVSEIATNVAGETASDLAGDVAVDILFGTILPFGFGFLLRKLLGGGGRPPCLNTIPAPPALNDKLINEWVMPRALLVQRAIAKHYLLPPPPQASS